MTRVGILLLCVLIPALCPACGDEPPAQPEDSVTPPAPEPIVLPLPKPPRRSLEEQARGLYMFDGDGLRLTLDLREGGAFRFLSVRKDGVSRSASGTWLVAQRGLVLTYTHQGGDPLADGPETVVQRWRGDHIELRETGTREPIVLRKRAVIRNLQAR